MPIVFLLLLGGCNHSTEHTHVFMVIIDTLRADIVEKVDTPNFDRIGSLGQRLQKSWAPSTWTAASTLSILSGESVMAHGWDYPMPKDLPKGLRYPPVQSQKMLAEALKAAGYQTTGMYGNQLLHRDLGFARGFDTWEYVPDAKIVAQLQQKIPHLSASKAQFMYIHLYGAHQPLLPSVASRKKFGLDQVSYPKRGMGLKKCQEPATREVYQKSYHAVVEDLDRLLGEITNELMRIPGKKILIVTSDHGELLGEHNLVGHDAYLYEPLTAVPLVVLGMKKLPDPFSLTNLSSSICSSLGLECPFFESRDVIFAQREKSLAILREGQKMIEGRCYQIDMDPREEETISCSKEIETEYTQLKALQEGYEEQGLLPLSFSPKRMEQLHRLGYLED